VGNFDGVFAMACDRAYESFLKVLERYPEYLWLCAIRAVCLSG
jgi:hypothetical protein